MVSYRNIKFLKIIYMDDPLINYELTPLVSQEEPSAAAAIAAHSPLESRTSQSSR